MKIYKNIVLVLALVSVVACSDFEYENAIDTNEILSDLTVAKRDFQSVPVITSYVDFNEEIVIQRSMGLSKELNVSIEVNTELLTTYNQQEGTNYHLLPETFYSFAENISFPKDTKSVTLTVTLKPNALFLDEDGDADTASNFVLPLTITGSQNGEALETTYSNVMLNMVYDFSTITVSVPDPITELTFVSGVDIAQKEVLEATANFTTLEVSAIDYFVDPQDVEDYNMEHGTLYELLPESGYTFGEVSFENLSVVALLEVHAALLDPSKEYLLPLRMQSSEGYIINQSNPIFIKVLLEEIILGFEGADDLLSVLTNTAEASGSIIARLNSALFDEMPIEFVVNEALVDTYNLANGTNFTAIGADKVNIPSGSIPVEQQSNGIPYTLDASELDLDGTDRYLIAFEIVKDGLLAGTNLEQEVVYVEVVKSLVGKYTYSNNTGFFWNESDLVDLNPDDNAYKYKVKSFGTTPGWWVGFNLTEEHYNGDPNLWVIELQPAFGEITTNNSYFDTIAGTLYFDIVFGDNEVARNALSDIQIVE